VGVDGGFGKDTLHFHPHNPCLGADLKSARERSMTAVPAARTPPASDPGPSSSQSSRSCRRLKGSEIGISHGEVDVIRGKQVVIRPGSVLDRSSPRS
jgi:hypothetical protein